MKMEEVIHTDGPLVPAAPSVPVGPYRNQHAFLSHLFKLNLTRQVSLA
jgi:hypothetical protein